MASIPLRARMIRYALAVRQPWAWRIIRAGKDVENRNWRTRFRGGVEIVDCVDSSESPWFWGDFGFVLENPQPVAFGPCRGMLGFWKRRT